MNDNYKKVTGKDTPVTNEKFTDNGASVREWRHTHTAHAQTELQQAYITELGDAHLYEFNQMNKTI